MCLFKDFENCTDVLDEKFDLNFDFGIDLNEAFSKLKEVHGELTLKTFLIWIMEEISRLHYVTFICMNACDYFFFFCDGIFFTTQKKLWRFFLGHSKNNFDFVSVKLNPKTKTIDKTHINNIVYKLFPKLRSTIYPDSIAIFVLKKQTLWSWLGLSVLEDPAPQAKYFIKF